MKIKDAYGGGGNSVGQLAGGDGQEPLAAGLANSDEQHTSKPWYGGQIEYTNWSPSGSVAE